MLEKIKSILQNYVKLDQIRETNSQLLINIAKLHFESISQKKIRTFSDYEYKVFSQFGEDGLINFILNNVNIKNKYFVEFGVEDYQESNTKLLLEAFNWSGQIFDSKNSFISSIKKTNFYWKFNLNVLQKFITSENINLILRENCAVDKISLLSIDIDGNDYWVWKAIDCTEPELVIIEYNSIFGYEKSVTIPYTPDFNRKKYHWSNSYFGASLNALYKLGLQKNYILIGTNSNGNNAFFVKRNCLKKETFLKERTPKECFNEATFKEARDKNGNILEQFSSTSLLHISNVINVIYSAEESLFLNSQVLL
jgi:hypothetical protein